MNFINEIKIEILFENFNKLKLNYTYNKFTTTFQDLFEFIAQLCPKLKICPCFRFKYKAYEGFREIYNNQKISSFENNRLRNLYLFNNNKGACFCKESTKNYLTKSKISIIDELNKNIEKLSRKLNDNKREINFLEKEKEEDKCQIHSLKKEKDDHNYQINSLLNEKEKQKNDIDSLENKIKKIECENKNKIELLNKEKEALVMAVDGDIDKIEKLDIFGININNFKKKKNLISVGKDNKIIVEKIDENEKINFLSFYDVIIGIKSIKDITQGWEIKMNDNTIQKYNEYKNQKTIKIGVIGNSNKGKSFLLSKISKITLPSGTSIRTEGLSIKYPDLKLFKDRKIILLDSAGLETPVLKKENEDNEDKEENEENNINNDNYQNNGKVEDSDFVKETGELANKEEEKGKSNNLNKVNDKKNCFFEEKSREKLITELFLQKYIIKYSDILIIVVGILTYSEQKLLNRIKLEIQRAKLNKTLFIIHNLITYTSVAQVDEYVKDFLLKSATFNLEEGHYISTKLGNTPGKYYYEKNTNPKIYHLLFANEGSDAGKKFNSFTLDFLENNYQNVTDLKTFDVISTVKQRFEDISQEIIEKTEQTSEKYVFDNSNQKLIKLKSPKNLILKKCLIDELGFSNLRANAFEPLYNCYAKNDKFIIRVEIPGNTDIDSCIDRSGEITLIKLFGEKTKDKEPEKLTDNICITREFGKFNVEIPVKFDNCIISNEEPDIKKVNGVCIFEYKLDKKKVKKGLKIKKEDEI